MQFIQGKNIPLTLQLVKSDLTYEEEATVTYDIYGNDLVSHPMSTQSVSWNDTFKCYYDELSPWVDQAIGNYVLKWNISDTELFPATMIEDLCVIPDETKIDAIQAVTDTLSPSGEYDTRLIALQTDITKLLGLNHENIYMDQPQYDTYDNLTSLRIRIYSNPLSVGTDTNVISTYRVTSVGDNSGKFTYWKQVELL